MANGQKATIRDVAKRAGVAVSTASRALSHGSASKATREKVFRAAGELNFVPNPAARQLMSGRSNIVAIAIPEHTISSSGICSSRGFLVSFRGHSASVVCYRSLR